MILVLHEQSVLCLQTADLNHYSLCVAGVAALAPHAPCFSCPLPSHHEVTLQLQHHISSLLHLSVKRQMTYCYSVYGYVGFLNYILHACRNSSSL